MSRGSGIIVGLIAMALGFGLMLLAWLIYSVDEDSMILGLISFVPGILGLAAFQYGLFGWLNGYREVQGDATDDATGETDAEAKAIHNRIFGRDPHD